MDKLYIKKIHIDGFGAWNNREIDGLSAGVSVIYGENEVGKTTLMEFIRAIFFGFHDGRSQKNRYLPVAGGSPGGYMEVGFGGELLRVERYKKEDKGRGRVRRLTGDHADLYQPEMLLGNISRSVYESVFAFGLDELQEVVKKNDLGGYIYSAGMGAAGVSVSRIKDNWTKQMEKLYRIGGTRPQANIILEELKLARSRIAELRTSPERYNEIMRLLHETTEEIEVLEKSEKETCADILWQEKLLNVWVDWRRIIVIDETLGDAGRELQGMNTSFPDLRTLDHAIDNKEEAEKNTGLLQDEITVKEEILSGLAVEEDLLNAKERVDVLMRYDTAKAQESTAKLGEDISAQKNEHKRLLEELPLDWNMVGRLDTSVFVRSELRKQSSRFAGLDGDIKNLLLKGKTLSEELDEIKNEKEALKARLASEFDGIRSNEVLSGMEKDLREMRGLVEKMALLDKELTYKNDLLARDIRQQEELNAGLKRVVPSVFFYGALVLFVVIFLSLLYLLPAGNVFWAVVVMFFLSAAVFILKHRRDAEKHSARLAADIELVGKRVADLKQDILIREGERNDCRCEFESLAVGFDVSSPLSAGLDVFEADLRREVEAARERNTMNGKINELSGKIEKKEEMRLYLEKERENISASLKELNEHWKNWLAGQEVDADVSPEELADMVQHIEKINICRENLSLLEKELAKGQNEQELFYSKALELISEFSPGVLEIDDPARWQIASELQKVVGRFESSRDNKSKRGTVSGAVEDLKIKLRAEQKKISGWNEKLEVVFQEASSFGKVVSDKEAFRKRYREIKALQQQLDEREKVVIHLKAILGDGRGKAEKELERLESDAGLKMEIERLNSTRETQRTRLSAAREKKGGLSRDLVEMESGTELADLVLKEEQLAAELEQVANKWTGIRLAMFCLERAEKLYEKEKQNPVYKKCGSFFSRMTNGRYPAVISHYDEEREIEVEDEHGSRIAVKELSRGTREQLYLAIRFAYALEFSERLGAFPIIMDDILVNVDTKRLPSVIDAVIELAETHQVLFFTCHEHIRNSFPGSIRRVRLEK